MRPIDVAALLLVVSPMLAAAGCDEEDRVLREVPAASQRIETIQIGDLQAGPARPRQVVGVYERDAYAIGEGRRLYNWYGCSGCHGGGGGGGMGPPLMDGGWIYGSDPANIFATIVQGRPNGMPAYRGMIPDRQVWQLVAYVQSLSGNVPKAVAPGRADRMRIREPGRRMDREEPTSAPAEHP